MHVKVNAKIVCVFVYVVSPFLTVNLQVGTLLFPFRKQRGQLLSKDS